MLIRSVTSVKKKNAYRVNSSRESFAQNHHIWTDFLVIHSQPSAGSRQARLHLISNPQHLDKTHEHLDLTCESTSQRKKKEKKIISCIHIVCSASRGASLYIQGLCNALHSYQSKLGNSHNVEEGEFFYQEYKGSHFPKTTIIFYHIWKRVVLSVEKAQVSIGWTNTWTRLGHLLQLMT